ncbi:hypothetical protein BJY04DRAFT_201621 [Aspergillus karnatakaensis]|uniref:uncharacterized protein n=1 Tax=Aspergillus karnatakaensis TaxID=1810916 RepID=UPI003CCC98AF
MLDTIYQAGEFSMFEEAVRVAARQRKGEAAGGFNPARPGRRDIPRPMKDEGVVRDMYGGRERGGRMSRLGVRREDVIMEEDEEE